MLCHFVFQNTFSIRRVWFLCFLQRNNSHQSAKGLLSVWPFFWQDLHLLFFKCLMLRRGQDTDFDLLCLAKKKAQVSQTTWGSLSILMVQMLRRLQDLCPKLHWILKVFQSHPVYQQGIFTKSFAYINIICLHRKYKTPLPLKCANKKIDFFEDRRGVDFHSLTFSGYYLCTLSAVYSPPISHLYSLF